MEGYKNKWFLIGIVFLAIAACDRKPNIRPGMCIRGMPETMSWEKCDSEGHRAMAKGDYFHARKYFLDAIARTEKLRPKDSRFTTTLDNLAKIYEAQGDLAHAESILLRLLALSENRGNLSDLLQLAASIDSLGKIQQGQNNWVEAEQNVKRALAIRMKKLDLSHPDVVSSKNSLALIYLDQGRVAEALKMLTWEGLIEGARLATERGDYARALLYLAEAINQYESGKISDDLQLAASLDPLGKIQQIQGNLVDAERNLKHALAIRMKKLDSSHPDVVSSGNGLGSVYWEQGRVDEARKMLTWEWFNEKAKLVSEKGDYAGAEVYLMEALKKAEEFGSQDPRLLNNLTNLTGIYQKQGKFTEAEPLLKLVLTIYEMKQDADGLSASLNNLAGIYQRQGRFAEAESLFKRSLAIHLKKAGLSNAEMISVQNNLAALYIVQKKYPEAEQVLKGAIDTVKKSKGTVPLMINLLGNYASLLQLMNRNEEAERVISEYMILICSLSNQQLTSQRWAEIQAGYCR